MRKYLSKFIIIYTCLFSLQVSAQEAVLEGKIWNSTNQIPIEGVTVTNKTHHSVGITSEGGKFHIKARKGDVIIFSHIGYNSQETYVKSVDEPLHISLSPNLQILSDVVITGALGIKKENRALGTSSKVVDNQLLNQAAVVNPLNGLASKVAGLRINMMDSKVDPQIQINLRGARSLNRMQNQPLFVLDGVPVPDISRINPNDIESITVLKGANAAALYGYEGVNGALMITTKTGKGENSRVQFSNTTTFSNVILLPPAQTKFGQGVDGKYVATHYESWGPAFDGSTQPFGKTLPDGTQPELLYSAPNKDGRLDLFQTGITSQNDISFSGGTKTSSYFLSGQYITSTGIIPADKNQRINLRFNGTRAIGKLSTSYNVSYSNTRNSFANDGPWHTTYTLPANLPFKQLKDWESPNSIGYPGNFFSDDVKNPFFIIGTLRNSTSDIFPVTAQNTFNAKAEAEYSFSKHFSALYRLGTYQNFSDYRATVKKFEAAGRRNQNGSVVDRNTYFGRWNSDLILNFNHQINDIGFKLLLGNNIRIDDQKELSLNARNLLLPDLFNQGSRIGELLGGSKITQFRSYSFYGELSTSYKNWLYLTLTGRNDNVSVLSPKNRSYFYPGISTSLVLSDAIKALKEQKWLSFAKIYGSYNRTGNVTLAPYSLNNAYSQVQGFPFGNLVGFSPSTTNPNPDLKPEFVTSYETGIQLGLFKNRVNFDAAYVYSNSNGQIFNAPQSRSTGYENAYVNAGTLSNAIWEFTFSGDAIKTQNTTLTLNATYSYIDNRVQSLYENLEQYPIFRQSYAVKGEAYPTLQVSDYERDPQGRVVVNPRTGIPLKSNTPVNLGTMVPPHMAGLGLQFSHRNFSVGVQLDGRWGSWLYSEIVPRMYTAGTHPATVEFNRQPFVWPASVVKNADGTYSDNNQEIANGGARAFWEAQGQIQRNTAAKGDFVKFRELSIGFKIPQKWISKMGMIHAARLGVVGNNLWMLRNKYNTMGDPEYLYNNTSGYLSFRQVPPVRTFGFNINITF